MYITIIIRLRNLQQLEIFKVIELHIKLGFSNLKIINFSNQMKYIVIILFLNN